jgi:chromosome segregation ATPase
MCKKVLIAALAVVVALAVVKGTWLGSHIRVWKNCCVTAVRERIPPEQEIQRLRMELDNLSKEDDRHFDLVARQAVEMQKLERRVAGIKKDLGEREARIRTLRTSLANQDKEITLNGESFPRAMVEAQLKMSAGTFQVDEETLHSLEGQLLAQKQVYTMNKTKLSKLKLARQEMLTDLQRLETTLAEERQAQAAERHTLDDAGFIKIRKDMDSVRDRIEVIKQKRLLKGEANGPVRAVEERREESKKLDQYIESRFGDKADKQ